MKKLLSQLESGFNKLVFLVIDSLANLYKSHVPDDVKEKIKKFFSPITDRYQKFKVYFEKKCSGINNNLQIGIKKFKDANLKQKIQTIIKFIKKIFSISFIKDTYKHKVAAPIATLFKVLERKIHELNQYHLVAFILILAITGMMSLGIYKSTYNIVAKEYKHKDRKIASFGFSEPKAFPDYFAYDQKLSLITQIEIPAYIESINDFRNLKVDFSIEFTNRTAKRFFDQYYHVFMDRLQITLEPVLPSFPLNPEGKNIVRDKLSEELNAILIDEDVDGRVKRVKIMDILAN